MQRQYRRPKHGLESPILTTRGYTRTRQAQHRVTLIKWNVSHTQSLDFQPCTMTNKEPTGLALDDNSLPGYPVGVSTYPYITSSPYLPSDLFPASTVAWPYSSGINTPAVTTHDSDFNTWQPTARYTGAITATPERVVPPPSYQAYAPSQPAQPRQIKGGPVGGQAFNLGQRIRNMQDYPSPQHSDVSAPSTSSRISVLPAATLSPSLALVAAQTSMVAGISGSLRGSEATQEPIRNSSGLFYCSHSEHATTPVFARKSEWT